MLKLAYIGKNSSLEDARALFLTARNGEAAAALAHDPSAEAALLRARCLLRLDDSAGAVRVLHHLDMRSLPSHRIAERHVVLGRALVRSRRHDEGRAHYDAAARIAAKTGGAAALELACCHALEALVGHDVAAASRITDQARSLCELPGDPYFRAFPVLRAQLLELSAAVAAEENRFARQAALLAEAWNALATLPETERDAWVQGSVLRVLAPLACDVRPLGGAELLWRARADIRWSAELAHARYAVNHALARQAELSGNHVAAFAAFRECSELAPSVPLRIESTLDRAFLASEFREATILGEEMLRAGMLARSISWDEVIGEQVGVLLNLAQAYARTDTALARHWLDRYNRGRAMLGRPRGAPGTTSRQLALEHDAQAAVLAAEGRTTDAVSARRAALEGWDALDHHWRAARSALALARLTRLPLDAEIAARRAAPFGRSWLGRGARGLRTVKTA